MWALCDWLDKFCYFSVSKNVSPATVKKTKVTLLPINIKAKGILPAVHYV